MPSEGNPPTFSQLMCLYLQQKDLIHFHQVVDILIYIFKYLLIYCLLITQMRTAQLCYPSAWGAVWRDEFPGHPRNGQSLK